MQATYFYTFFLKTCLTVQSLNNNNNNNNNNISKYKDLIIEIQHMWNVKGKVIPVITGATGPISESFRTSEQHTRKAQNEGTTKKKQPCRVPHSILQ